MNLHNNIADFWELIENTSRKFGIKRAYVEKDYWITMILNKLSKSEFVNSVVFKGGTSLTKAYRIINRFSEDIDIALLDEHLTGNALKTKIRNIEKQITADLTEIVEQGITCKGSVYRKSLFEYPNNPNSHLQTNIQRRIIVEINSFANPHPFVNKQITSFIAEYLMAINQNETIKEYGLQPFTINVLDKQRTMIEKLVSLLRFSFSENSITALSAKIRHFYDLHHLVNNDECANYIQSGKFKNDLSELFAHDQTEFNEPINWQTKTIVESPLITDFPAIWKKLKFTYQNELEILAFADIPKEKLVEESFTKILKHLSE